MASIIALNTLLPEYSYTSEEGLEFYKKWISTQSVPFQKKALKIFENVNVTEKHIIAPIEVLFSNRTFEESNNLYIKKAVELGTKILKETLEKAGIKPEEIDFIITTSCTGYMIPSLEAYLIDKVGLRKDIKRLPVTEMGCAAGASALIYANDFLKAYPDKKAAVITFEFPSNTMQLDDYSWDNVVGTALFADGVACAILGNSDSGPEIVDSQMFHLDNTTEILGYNITNKGLKMTLDKTVPNVIEDNFVNIVEPFLNKNNLSMVEIDEYLPHPGGIKILDKIETVLSKYGKNVKYSRKIMQTYGNLSSSTILFILNELMKELPHNTNALLLSFGPGFTAQNLLMKWS